MLIPPPAAPAGRCRHRRRPPQRHAQDLPAADAVAGVWDGDHLHGGFVRRQHDGVLQHTQPLLLPEATRFPLVSIGTLRSLRTLLATLSRTVLCVCC